MRFRLFNNKANRTNRLARKIGKRLDREDPKRKLGKIIAILFSLGLMLLGAFVDDTRAAEVIVIVLPFVLCALEYLRLKNRAPRRKWREVMIISGIGIAIFAFFPFAMWMDGADDEQLNIFLLGFAALSLLMVTLFGYALWRYRNIKHQIEEEKEQLRRRYEREKRLEKLNTL